MNKKGDLGIEMIGKILFALLALLVLIVIIGLISGKSAGLLETIKSIFTFGR